jgi:threonine/homoserine/homoserine lactone efflux protein
LTLYSTIGFSLAMLVLAASPGPGVFATVARAIASGFRPALAVICGIVLGDILFLMLAVFGLSMIAQALGDLFFVVKICGGAYLIFLGIKIWMREPELASTENGRSSGSGWGNFVSGLIITLSNPKVILFYCGFLPTFLDLSVLTLSDLALVVSIVTIVLACVLSTYALLASRARRMFTNKKAARRLNRTAGGVMIATGVVIATRS